MTTRVCASDRARPEQVPTAMIDGRGCRTRTSDLSAVERRAADRVDETPPGLFRCAPDLVATWPVREVLGADGESRPVLARTLTRLPGPHAPAPVDAPSDRGVAPSVDDDGALGARDTVFDGGRDGDAVVGEPQWRVAARVVERKGRQPSALFAGGVLADDELRDRRRPVDRHEGEAERSRAVVILCAVRAPLRQNVRRVAVGSCDAVKVVEIEDPQTPAGVRDEQALPKPDDAADVQSDRGDASLPVWCGLDERDVPVTRRSRICDVEKRESRR